MSEEKSCPTCGQSNDTWTEGFHAGMESELARHRDPNTFLDEAMRGFRNALHILQAIHNRKSAARFQMFREYLPPHLQEEFQRAIEELSRGMQLMGTDAEWRKS